MEYRCPSCKMRWEDTLEPLKFLSEPLCVFCSKPHTEKELLEWQLHHLGNMETRFIPSIIRRLYRNFKGEIEDLKNRIEDGE